jgi:hypothetical protein
MLVAQRERRPYRSSIDVQFHYWDYLNECPECGECFWSRFWSVPVFCSPDCKRTARDRRRKQQRDERRDQRLLDLARDGRCQVCGEPTEPNRRTRKYCSAKCRVRAARMRTDGRF